MQKNERGNSATSKTNGDDQEEKNEEEEESWSKSENQSDWDYDRRRSDALVMPVLPGKHFFRAPTVGLWKFVGVVFGTLGTIASRHFFELGRKFSDFLTQIDCAHTRQHTKQHHHKWPTTEVLFDYFSIFLVSFRSRKPFTKKSENPPSTCVEVCGPRGHPTLQRTTS